MNFRADYSLTPLIVTAVIAFAFATVAYMVFFLGFKLEAGTAIALGVFSVVMVLVGAIIILKGLMLVTGIGYSYGIDEKGITITSFFKKIVFEFDGIESVRALTSDQVGDLVFRLGQRQLKEAGESKTGKAFETGMETARLGKYCTVAVPQGFESLNIGSDELSISAWMKAIKINPKEGNYILIEEKDKKLHLISPKDISGFLDHFQSINFKRKD